VRGGRQGSGNRQVVGERIAAPLREAATQVFSITHRLFRKTVQQGRSQCRGEAYSLPYVEPLNAARTPLAGFINSLLVIDDFE
jgi:hypothetical protein